MKNTVKDVTEKQAKNLAYRKSLGIAKFVSPLRHVLAKHQVKSVSETGVVSYSPDALGRKAILAAKHGDGGMVQCLARHTMKHG